MIANNSIESQICEYSKEIGFDICNFANADQLHEEIALYEKWIESGLHANMHYLDKNYDKKMNPQMILPDVQSVIVLGHLYNTPFDYDSFDEQKHSKISRYAWGDDYHNVLGNKADLLIEKIKLIADCQCVRYIDTGPVLEKAWAVRAGAGWQGKNGNILNFHYGSYFFIAVIFTTLKLQNDLPVDDYCGTCDRCIRACPTNAIVAPMVVDSRKCLSYWNIEAKITEEVPQHIRDNFQNRLYGCDICQEVCPWNSKKKFTADTSFYPRNNQTYFDLNEVSDFSQEFFSARFKNSPIKRRKLAGLKLSAEIIKENIKNCDK